MKQRITNCLRYASMYAYIVIMHIQAQSPAPSQGIFVVLQIQDSIYNLKQAVAQISQRVASSNPILTNINKLKGMIKTANDQAGITQAQTSLKAAQDALDQSIASLFNHAFDQQGVSLYRKIYGVLQELFNDSVIKEKTNTVSQLQLEMVLRMTNNPNAINRTKQIQDSGQKISQQAATQLKAIDQIRAQGQQIKSQLDIALMNNPQIAALEQKIHQKNIALQQAINELPNSVKMQIKQHQNTMQKSNFILQYIQDPRKAAITTPETIITKEMDWTFATMQ